MQANEGAVLEWENARLFWSFEELMVMFTAVERRITFVLLGKSSNGSLRIRTDISDVGTIALNRTLPH